VTVLTYNFSLEVLRFVEIKSCGVTIEGVGGVGVGQQLGQEGLKDV